jgi:hypothetical protein
MRTLRLVEIAELLGVSKQRAHQLADEPGFPAPIERDGRGRLWSQPGHGVGEGMARSAALAVGFGPHSMREHPPPDPDGRTYIFFHFEGGERPEWDFGESMGTVTDIKEQQLEASEGLEVVGYYDDGDEWMLVDAIVDRFNPQGHYDGSWVARRGLVDVSSIAKAWMTIAVTQQSPVA